LIEQAAQFLRGLLLPGPLPVDKSLAKFLRGRKGVTIFTDDEYSPDFWVWGGKS
jgi:hypothetical protein